MPQRHLPAQGEGLAVVPMSVAGHRQVGLTNPVSGQFAEFVQANAKRARLVARRNAHAGKTVVICGAGPSLDTAEARVWLNRPVHAVWGCNRVAPWLCGQGLRVDAAVGTDQTLALNDEWATPPPVRYYVASSVNPALVAHLERHGRQLIFFHSHCGIPEPASLSRPWRAHGLPYEGWLYATLYPETCCVRDGLNVVTRAIGLALYLGYRRIVVLGADSALRWDGTEPPAEPRGPEYTAWASRQVFYCDGKTATDIYGPEPFLVMGRIDGRLWVTRPDMGFTAETLAAMAEKLGPRLELVGDTFPRALRGRPGVFKMVEALVDRAPA